MLYCRNCGEPDAGGDVVSACCETEMTGNPPEQWPSRPRRCHHVGYAPPAGWVCWLVHCLRCGITCRIYRPAIAKRPEPRVTYGPGRGATVAAGPPAGIPFFFKLVNLLKAHGSRRRTPSDSHGS